MFAALAPIRDYIYLALFLILVGFGVYEHFHLIHEGATHELSTLQKSSDKLNAAADAKIINLNVAHAADLKAIKEKADAQAKIDSASLAGDAERLREYDAYRRSHPSVGGAAPGPATSPNGNISPVTDDDRFSRLEQLGLQLAAANAAGKRALTSCMADRDWLVGK